MADTGVVFEGPAPRDLEVLSRVNNVVSIEAVDLTRVDFYSFHDGPLPGLLIDPVQPDGTGVAIDTDLSPDGRLLGCTFDFAVESLGFWDATIGYRALYNVAPDAQLTADEIEQFVWYDGLISVWPFYRELLISLTQRAGFPPVVVATLPALTSDVGS